MSNTVDSKWDKYYVNNDEALALLQMWRNGSVKDRTIVEKQIIHRLSYLVYSRVKGYKGKQYYEDLLQEGKAGLLESVRKFDSARGINFFKYGCWHIQNRIGRYLAKHRRQNRFEVLTDGEAPMKNQQGKERYMGPEELYEEEEGKRVLISALGSLPEIDRRVVLMRFGIDGSGGHTYKQIGDVFSVSKQRIEQITSRAISRLRKNTQIKNFFCEL